MRRFLRRLRNVFWSGDADRELSREIGAHLTLLQDEYERRGMSRDEAWRAARLALGGVERARALHRDARAFLWLDDARQDVVHAIRLLRRSPAFTLTAALSLAIGIGANTAIFTVANALLFRAPDGIVEPDALVDIGTMRGDGGLNPMPLSTYLEISRRATTLSGVYAQHMFPRAMSVSGESLTTERMFGHYVTAGFFTVLGATPAAGRLFDTSDDDGGDANPVAVLSHGLWVRRFDRSPAVIGQGLRVNGRLHVVVGVAAPGFQGTGVMTPDIWLPLATDDGRGSVLAVGRVGAGVSAAQMAAELAAIGDSIGDAPAAQRRRVHVVPSSRVGGNRTVVSGFAAALMAIVSLVLAVACANVTAIVLARSTARMKEMALRTALGAHRGRLVRQLLTETLIVFSLGGVLGLLLAKGMLLAVTLLPALPVPVQVPLSLDARVLAFTAMLSLLTAIASGLVPAMKGSKAAPATALKDDSSAAPASSRTRGALVVAQVALSLLLIVMTGLLIRALRYAGASDPGFEARGVDIAALDTSMASYTDGTRPQFWRDVIAGVRELPDVEAATLARVAPGGFEGIGLGSVAPAGASSDEASFVPSWNIVDSGYFATLRIPLRAGRDFGDRDVAGAQPVAIVGEGVARRLWPTKDAVGEHLALTTFDRSGAASTRAVLVVGVAGDVKSSSLIDGLADSYVYLPLRQSDTPLLSLMTTQMTIMARSRAGQRLDAGLGALVRRLNPALAIVRSETVEDSIALGLAPQRVLTTMTGSLGLVGLLLAAVGIYGVTAYSVARRSRELGIRLALGAPRRAIVGMVLRQGLLLTACGSVAGLVLAAGVSQILSVFLYGLPALHVPTFAGAAILFVAVGLMACYIPARRAVGVDPLHVLRYE